ncbi:MAG: carboxylate-amine ligase [Pseudomonadota bacterium]
MERPSFTLGIEEEYLVVDRQTRDVVRQPDPDFLTACGDAIGKDLAPEFLQCQIEVGTGVHGTAAAAGEELLEMRRGIARVAEAHGYAAIAASTHPFASWRDQSRTQKDRYIELADDLGATVRRMLICGCHVHVGIEDADLRIDLMNQAAYFLPHLLALSTSSPYWAGEDTKLASFRLTVFDALPRTGLPDMMHSYAEYRRMVDHLIEAGCLEDATKIWWDIRPSDRFPTLEQRVTDVCSRVQDTVTIAALFQALLAMLWRLRSTNQRWRLYPTTLIYENRWRAQRYGVSGGLVDHGKTAIVPFSDLIEELIELALPEAEALRSVPAILHAREIAVNGTSAQRQRSAFKSACKDGADDREALVAVVDALIGEFTPAV